MSVTRREFIQSTGLAAAGTLTGGLTLLTGCGGDPDKRKGARKVAAICPGCGLGCGINLFIRKNRIVDITGDTDHPLNEGAICPRAVMVKHFADDPENKRLKNVLYRKPGSSEWEEIPLKNAVSMIAERIKETRERTFVKKKNGVTYNRTDGIAFLAGDWMFNEELYLLGKLSRIVGSNLIDHESTLYSGSAGTALSGTLGFASSTNPLTDIRNSDAVLVIGSNPAENYPLALKQIMKTRERGGKVITIDPRFTRTSSISDIHISLRPGTDAAFINGIINYILKNGLFNREYLSGYTNASFLINPDYSFNEGVFSGYNSKTGSYDSITWTYQIDAKGIPKRDRTLKNSNTVFQLLKKHVSRYTPAVVSDITGCSVEEFLRIAEIYSETGKTNKSGAVIFSSASVRQLSGKQNVRAFAILQLILGNIGVSGGGLIQLRRGMNDQGAADNGTRWDSLPGYLRTPHPEYHPDMNSYLEDLTPRTNDPMSYNIMGTDGSKKGKGNTAKFMVNLLKAWFGGDSTGKPEDVYSWLPRSTGPFGYSDIVKYALWGKLEGAVLLNTDPVKELPDRSNTTRALKNLKWLVCADFSETGASSFWKNSGIPPERIMTEVFLIPQALPFEKSGSVTNSDRWIQWCGSQLEIPDNTVSGLDLLDMLYAEIRGQYLKGSGRFPGPVFGARWDYSGKDKKADPLRVLEEMNGLDTGNRMLLESYRQMRDDGGTSGGNWLYSGCVTVMGNRTADRGGRERDELDRCRKWGWSWPLNIRILHNLAGVDRKGMPLKKGKAAIQWNGSNWEGDATYGSWGPGSKYPFVMFEEGVARIFSPSVSDGPLPEYYESPGSPFGNPLNSIMINPVFKNLMTGTGRRVRKVLPHLGTVVRMGDYCNYSLSGNLPLERELVPGIFCEIDRELAESLDIESGDSVSVATEKGEMRMPVMVTGRLIPCIINGMLKHLISVIDSGNIFNPVNTLAHGYSDPDSGIIETGIFMAEIKKV
jgi:formate dehydrogenase major subunit